MAMCDSSHLSRPELRRTQSQVNSKKRHPSPIPSSPGHLPHHLQDPNHPRLRRRRPSTLSTHSYDVNSPAPYRTPSRGQPSMCSPALNTNLNQFTHFVFPPVHSPVVSQNSSSSPTPWFHSPIGEFDYWASQYAGSKPPQSPGQQSTCSYSVDHLGIAHSPLPAIKVKPPSTKRNHSSMELLELENPPRNVSTPFKKGLSSVKSVDYLNIPCRTRRVSNPPTSTPTRKYHSKIHADSSPRLLASPSGHSPSMRSFEMLDRQASSSRHTRSQSLRRPYHMVHPSTNNNFPLHLPLSETRTPRKSYDILEMSVTPLHQRSDRALGPRKSLDFNDIDCSFPSNDHHHTRYGFNGFSPFKSLGRGNWYDGDSRGSLSGVSTCAVVHPHQCTPTHAGGLDYLSPICTRPHYQIRRELNIGQVQFTEV